MPEPNYADRIIYANKLVPDQPAPRGAVEQSDQGHFVCFPQFIIHFSLGRVSPGYSLEYSILKKSALKDLEIKR